MRNKLNIIEVDNRPSEVRAKSTRARDERELLSRKLAAVEEAVRQAWEQGFVAGLDAMAQAGERKFPRGTSNFEDQDTVPYRLLDPELLKTD